MPFTAHVYESQAVAFAVVVVLVHELFNRNGAGPVGLGLIEAVSTFKLVEVGALAVPNKEYAVADPFTSAFTTACV